MIISCLYTNWRWQDESNIYFCLNVTPSDKLSSLGLLVTSLDYINIFGADDGVRTHDIGLGRTALYQLSYVRMILFITEFCSGIFIVRPELHTIRWDSEPHCLPKERSTSFRATPVYGSNLARLVGLEPTYSNYSVNDRLEGGWDTSAKFGGLARIWTSTSDFGGHRTAVIRPTLWYWRKGWDSNSHVHSHEPSVFKTAAARPTRLTFPII